MVAVNFKKDFVPLILAGKKKMTIRHARKIAPIKPGDTLQLFTGLRTDHCDKFAEAVCRCVCDITIDKEYIITQRVGYERAEYMDKEAFAKRDGFHSFKEMYDFFEFTYNEFPFRGVLIEFELIETSKAVANAAA